MRHRRRAAGTEVGTELATDVPIPTAIAFDRDGTLHAVRDALVPDGAEVSTVTP